MLRGRSTRSAHQHLASLLAQRFYLDQQALTVVRRRPRILRGVRLDELALFDLVEACEKNGLLAFREPVNRFTTKVGTMKHLSHVLAMNYMEADKRPTLVLIMMRIPAEHVDVAFAVASLFMFEVEERSLFKFECGAVWGYAEVRVTT